MVVEFLIYFFNRATFCQIFVKKNEYNHLLAPCGSGESR